MNFRIGIIFLAVLLVVACQSSPPSAEPTSSNTKQESVSLDIADPFPSVPKVVTAGGGKIEYLVRFPKPQTHYLEVVAKLPRTVRPGLTLMMPVWTPGSYLVREYARHVEGLQATGTGGRNVGVIKIAKNRWMVEAKAGEQITLSYRVYCREMTVRTNWVDSELAVISPAATFITLADDNFAREYQVTIELPGTWRGAYTGLPVVKSVGRRRIFRAADFDTLVDSPFVVGNAAVYRFKVGGTPYALVNQGEGSFWDGKRAAKDVEKIVKATVEMWGTVPYQDYTFLNVIDDARGGLEHKNSTLMMTSRFSSKDPERYRSWLGLVSHEFFHTWNVKRLRPEALGPFDYENENYTHGLWISEGFTSYYDDLLLRRAGLVKHRQYLELLSKQIKSVQTTPGRKVHPVGMSSYDAWIKYYRRDENTWNTTVSYYSKGALIAFLLDVKIRKATDGKKTLDDLMRLAYKRFSGEKGFSTSSFRAAANEVYGGSLDDFFEATVDGVGELDYSEALSYYGLEFEEAKKSEEEDESENPISGWVGAKIGFVEGRYLIRSIPRETPAFEYGLNAQDEVLALDGFRIPSGGWDSLLKLYRPGQKVTLTISRRGILTSLDLRLGQESTTTWKLAHVETPTESQTKAIEAWIGEDEEKPEEEATEEKEAG